MFCDLHIEPRSPKEATMMAEILRRSGFRCVGLAETSYGMASPIFIQRGFKVLRTIVVEASSERDAKARIKRVTKKSGTVIIGRTSDAAAFRFFSRDSRVDVVEASRRTVNLVDRNEALILRKSGSLIGLRMWVLLKNPRNISWMKALATRIFRHDIPFAIYSSAKEWSQLWHPRHLYSLFHNWTGYGRYAYLGLARPAYGENVTK